MKKFNLSKMIIIALIIVIAALSAIAISARNFTTDRSPAAMTQTINDGTSFFDKIIGTPVNFVQDKANEVSNLMNTYKQNESLKKQLSSLKDDKNQLESTQAENKELKKELGLQETLTDYETVNANVITRNPASWSDTLVIDRGKKDDLKDGMVVMANGGIIGRIIQVNQNSAKVALLSATKGIANKIPVLLGSASNPTYGILSGYDSKQGTYIVNNVDSQVKLKKGSQVFTSGLGSGTTDSIVSSPKGLLVGTVVSTKYDDQGLDHIIYVKPSSSLYDISFVSVVKRQIGGNE
ncbi:rod shape-determining protein MreC [Lactococcus nasutitermitis]|uniref:Cell shape-determining protein MreC n=1 Tax=Lactococcus nasutitermitis TaxID=1652957 RepID=A0ABV9JFM8_9LACT|nr:rod shape-determining protein MreC [Lactococcus nasutitermitis]